MNGFIRILTVAAIGAMPCLCQEHAPVYRVTVIQRTVDAVNYQYRNGPTKIDFAGTVLLPTSKGDATVESKQGRTEIDAKFDGLVAPQRFGPEYLSYVLWAITPDGNAHNLGEIVPNGSNHGHLAVTTDLQVFGLLVTAEPYALVRAPGDVVVMQNQVRPDTIGDVHPVMAKVELMPRGHYTWNVPSSESTGVANAPKVSMSRYEAILQTYEAQNAIGIATTAGAQQYAPDVLAKAEKELSQAQQLQATKGNDDMIVQHARAAIEMAEDARIIADRHRQDAALIAARQQTAMAQQAQQEAQQTAEREKERADNAQAMAQMEREARQRAEADAKIAREQAEQATVVEIQPSTTQTTVTDQQSQRDAQEKQFRTQLLERLNMAIVTRDTPRGLDATLNDADFDRGQLRPASSGGVARLAGILAAYPHLQISVEGNSDTPEGSELARQRAQSVVAALTAAGIPAGQITTDDYGNSRPIVSNSTEQGRMENRRVEIVITGNAIGTVPSWDRTYPISLNRR
ncbi:MAG TPA: OmpA family protein [Bryobacteraceae bacterium]|nr:OmpA family protein [Bryobacteraceae bacterium]